MIDKPKEVDLSPLDYDGEETIEALLVLDTYSKECCNVSATSRKLNKTYNRVKRYLSHPYVRELFKLSFLRKGITPEKIAETINRGLTATTGIYWDGKKVAEEDNWLAQNKSASLAMEVFEVGKETKIQVNQGVTNIAITIEEKNELKMLREKIIGSLNINANKT